MLDDLGFHEKATPKHTRPFKEVPNTMEAKPPKILLVPVGGYLYTSMLWFEMEPCRARRAIPGTKNHHLPKLLPVVECIDKQDFVVNPAFVGLELPSGGFMMFVGARFSQHHYRR